MMDARWRPVLAGLLLGLFTLLYAEFMASTFGLYEDDIKAALYEEALEHTEGIVVPGHEGESDLNRKVFKTREEAKKYADKAWVYLKRAHMHGEGLGAIAIAVCLLIGVTTLRAAVKRWLALVLSLGAAVYPWCWFYLGVVTPDKGKYAAKADVHWIAVGSVTLYLGALICLFVLLLLYRFGGTSKFIRYFYDEAKPA